MNRLRHVLAAIVLAFTLTACVGAEAKTPEIPGSLIGTWKVTKVYWLHDRPWPDGTPKQWFIGMPMVVTKYSITARPTNYDSKDGMPKIFYEKLNKISKSRRKIRNDISFGERHAFTVYEIHGKCLNFFKNTALIKYSLSFRENHREWSDFDNRSYSIPSMPVSIYKIDKNEIVIPNYALSSTFLILTRVSTPVS